ncbi:MAG: hypothetical protein WKG06_18385 [Segetibacter sp.]
MLNYKGEEEKYSIRIQNLKDALNYAEQDLKNRGEFYRERFYKKLKKKK